MSRRQRRKTRGNTEQQGLTGGVHVMKPGTNCHVREALLPNSGSVLGKKLTNLVDVQNILEEPWFLVVVRMFLVGPAQCAFLVQDGPLRSFVFASG